MTMFLDKLTSRLNEMQNSCSLKSLRKLAIDLKNMVTSSI